MAKTIWNSELFLYLKTRKFLFSQDYIFKYLKKYFFYVRSIILHDFHELIPYLRILKFFCFHYPHSKPPYFWVDPQNNIISIPFVYLASLLIRINTAVSDFKKFVKFTTWFWKGGSDWDHEYISF